MVGLSTFDTVRLGGDMRLFKMATGEPKESKQVLFCFIVLHARFLLCVASQSRHFRKVAASGLVIA